MERHRVLPTLNCTPLAQLKAQEGALAYEGEEPGEEMGLLT